MTALTTGWSWSANAAALTKGDMKPSLTPCFLAKASLYLFRIWITLVMSTSLKVVSMAYVFCASFSLCAILWRMRLIFTLCSVLAPTTGAA